MDIKANAAIQKGMPHKGYHGRTGVVFNVTPRAVGVIVNKIVREKQLKKRIHVRIEHVAASRCRDDFLNRVKVNDAIRSQAHADGKPVPNLKRVTRGPRAAKFVKGSEINVTTIAPVPYVFTV